MKNSKYILVILLFLLCQSLCQSQSSEFKVQGTVVDTFTNERLAFVNIIINETGTLGTTTDIDGKFSISSKEKINALTFSFVGYEKKHVAIDNESEILIELKPQNIQLSEIVIDGNNNPANRIIDSVYKYRDANNPRNLDSYYYKMYDNMVFTVDTSWIKANNKIGEQLKNNDLLAMETVSEQYFLKPNKNKKNILANKVSGFENPVFIYLLESIQSIGFYDDLINIDNKKCVNPISKNSKNKYIFVLESALKNEDNDSIFVISFQPYRSTNFEGLKGTITVNSDNWAIQNIKASPSKLSAMYNIEIQQLYEKVDDEFWFPKQLNTTIATYDREKAKNTKIASANDSTAQLAISANGGANLPLLGIGKSYITDIEINKDIDKKIFDNADFHINDNAANADETIRYYRYEKLSDERMEATYKFVDSILDDANINLDKITSTLSSMIEDDIPIGCINLKISDFANYNIGNGYMIGLGIGTNNRLSKVFSIEGFGDYWFKAKEFNYGGNVTFNIMRSLKMKIQLGAYHKFERLGNYGFRENKNMLNSDNFKHFYTKSTSLNNSIYVDYSTYLNKYIKGFIKFGVYDKSMGQQSYRLSTIDLKLRIAFGEKFVISKDGLQVKGDANPVIWLSYQKNLKNVFGSPYDFDKYEFLFRGKKYSQFLGETSLSVQFGYITGLAPVTDLFNLYGTGENKFDIYCPESFSTMHPDEFFCDKFAALYFSHNFKNILIDFKKFHPEIIVLTNIAWFDGTQQLSNSATQQLYYESGIMIDNLINIGIVKLGLGAFYRYGPYSHENTWDNFVFKVGIEFSL